MSSAIALACASVIGDVMMHVQLWLYAVLALIYCLLTWRKRMDLLDEYCVLSCCVYMFMLDMNFVALYIFPVFPSTTQLFQQLEWTISWCA